MPNWFYFSISDYSFSQLCIINFFLTILNYLVLCHWNCTALFIVHVVILLINENVDIRVKDPAQIIIHKGLVKCSINERKHEKDHISEEK